jgi:hypothetical protein
VATLGGLLLIGGGAGTAYFLYTLDDEPSSKQKPLSVTAERQARLEAAKSEKAKFGKAKAEKVKAGKAKAEKAKQPNLEPEKAKQAQANLPPLFFAKVAGAPIKPKPEVKPPAEPASAKTSPIALAGVNKAVAVPKSDPAQIANAIRRGIEFLQKDIKPSGTWLKEDESLNSVGYAALPALALLESNVPAGDAAVQKAAAYVRKHAAEMTDTYDLGMAVLFLEKLGEPRDKTLIKSLALRIVAGQSPAGGWDYKCPVLTPEEGRQLLKFLQRNRPKTDFLVMLPAEPKDSLRLAVPSLAGVREAAPKQASSSSASRNLREAAPKQDGKGLRQPAPKTEEGKAGAAGKDRPGDSAAKAAEKSKKTPPASGKRPDQVSKFAKELAQLSPELRELPIVQYKKTKEVDVYHRDDNSNTQFGLLALWTARRHGVPTELSLEMAGKRFQLTQRGDGGWGYVTNAPTKNAMTCVGLLGLALGHGSAAEAARAAAKGFALANPPYRDPFVLTALDALGEYLDGDFEKRGLEARIDFYFLWTLERVGVLYQRKTFGTKDWYDWGAEMILKRQLQDGSWLDHYPPAVDTSFALLFLNRSNPVGNLREALPYYLAIPRRESLSPDPAIRGKEEPARTKGN